MILIFYLVDFLLNLAFTAGFFYRYKQTTVVHYAYLGAAALAMVMTDTVLAFLIGNIGHILFIVNGAIIINMIAGLVTIYVVLNLITIWIASVKRTPQMGASKMTTSERVFRVLKILYPVLTLLSAIFWIMDMVNIYIGAFFAFLVGVAWTGCVMLQTAICVWMYLDIEIVSNASQIAKRSQLTRLIGLSFFNAWPALFSGMGVGYIASVCWWIWMGIALWPNALVGFEVEPQITHAAAHKGMEAAYPRMPQQAYDSKPNVYGKA